MTTPESSNAAVRRVITSLLDGVPVPPIAADHLGAWAPMIVALQQAYDGGGTEAVRVVYAALCRADSRLSALRAVDTPASIATSRDTITPPLPDDAARLLTEDAGCGHWLDDYTAFSAQAAPTAPYDLHEAAGLFCAATAVARRICFRYRYSLLYPNLYILYMGQSGTGKTQIQHVLRGVLKQADILHLLLSNQMTPENLVTQLSLLKPLTLQRWSQADKNRWVTERAFAAQRAWIVDEASFLFDSISGREYMAGMLYLILKLYDCEDELTRETQTGGRITLENISLSFFGTTTPEGMKRHLVNPKLWQEGCWPRFALLSSPTTTPMYFDDDDHVALDLPPTLSAGLRQLYDYFPVPEAELEAEEVDGVTTESLSIWGSQPPTEVTLGPDVYTAWKTYRRALFTISAAPDTIEPELRGSYQRLAAHAIKVAMLLAALDAATTGHGTAPHVVIERPHLVRALTIVERWRANLHDIWHVETQHDEQLLSDRILQKLAKPAPNGGVAWTVRELGQWLKQKSKPLNESLTVLQDAGLVRPISGRTVRWMRAVHSGAGVDDV